LWIETKSGEIMQRSPVLLGAETPSGRARGEFNVSRVLAAVVCGLTAGTALAQSYPTKTVRIVHGFASGSAIDVMIRPVAQKLSEQLGQSFVVDARPGATGVIANELVAKAAPDGYTVLAAPGSSLVSTPHLRKVPFDALKDYAPVGLTTTFSFFMVAHPAVPAKNAAELIALGKRRADLTFGSTGVGSAFHLAGELFAQLSGIKLLHVPYRGGGTGAINDLIGGRVDLMFESPAVVAPYVRAGRLNAIGCTGPVRNALLPQVPTIAESGLKTYSLRGWHGMLLPAATPRAIVERMNAALNRALQTPETKELWAKMGMETPSTTPEQFAALLRSDFDRYGKLVGSLGLKVD
jgi:tripartite-type tricarboxylate transporter receptor subunit TctC